MTRAGHLRVVLNKDTKDGEEISKTIQKAVGKTAKSVTLKDYTTVQISDVDEEATDDEILSAITENVGSPEDIRIRIKRKVGRGTQMVYVSIPTADTHSHIEI